MGGIKIPGGKALGYWVKGLQASGGRSSLLRGELCAAVGAKGAAWLIIFLAIGAAKFIVDTLKGIWHGPSLLYHHTTWCVGVVVDKLIDV